LKLRRSLSLLAPVLICLSGCAGRSSTAFIEIENDQSGRGERAEPIFVDPSLDVVQNEYRRGSSNDGSNIMQKIKIRGPLMIVPAPSAATRPVAPR
jgi:hypothetical protein